MRQRVEALQRQKVRGRSKIARARCWPRLAARRPQPPLPGSFNRWPHTNSSLSVACPPQADAQAQLAEQAERQGRAAARAARLRKQAEAKGPAGCGLPPGVGLEALAADVQLAQVREATRGMVEALRGVAAEHPALNLVQRVEAEAGVRLPAGQDSGSRPGSAAAAARLCSGGSSSGRGSPCSSRLGTGAAAAAAARSPARSRPGSCAGSVRSAASSVAARGSPSAKSPAVQTIALQL